jgi:hypothetical protein
MGLETVVTTSKGKKTLAELRTEFLILDILELRRGGIKTFSYKDQCYYVELAQRTGILSNDVISEIKKEFNLTEIPDYPFAETDIER